MRLIILILIVSCTSLFAQNIWVNEFHYDNPSTDENEFIEIILDTSDASYTLSDFTISLYNGSTSPTTGGKIYNTKTLNQYTRGTTDSSFIVFYYNYPVNGIQNGDPDGICIDYQGTVVPGQFISYGGTFEAKDGPALGMTSVDIGVVEGSSSADSSLQLTGTGTTYANFEWQEPRDRSPGFVNDGQTLKPSPILPEPSNHVTNFKVDTVTNASATLTWTGSVGAQVPQKYLVMARSSEATFYEVKDSLNIDDDSDWSDGVIAQNLSHQDGENGYTFSGLNDTTKYFFTIYPYTNTGVNTDYKTDPPIPVDSAITRKTPLIAISEIRQNLNDYKGKLVKIAGIVTGKVSGKSELDDGFFMQDKAQPWSGIYIADEAYASSVAMADSIIISGEVTEVFGLPQLINISKLETVSGEYSMPGPYDVTTGTFADDQYLCLLVKIAEAQCTNPDAGHGEWQINDGSGVMNVDDLIYAFTPEGGKNYTVTGLGYYAFGSYKLVPRNMDDIKLITTAPIIIHIGSSALAPESDTDFIDTVMVTSKFELDTVVLKYTVNRGLVTDIPMIKSGNDSTFTATIEAASYSDGDAIEYWIFATNTNYDTTESSKRGYFAGMTNISSLLQLDDQKALIYNGLYARTNGVATVANGVLHGQNLSVAIQYASYGAIRLFKSNAANYIIEPGHNYTIVGMVNQYNGLNQIIPEDTLTDITDNGLATMPDAFTIDLATLLSAPESFENLLIRIENADTLGAGDNWPGKSQSANMIITDDAGVSDLELRIERSTDIGGNTEPAWPQHITGVFGQYDWEAPYDEGYQILPRSMNDFSDATGIQATEKTLLPTKLALHNAYPNPFNPSTTISYDIPSNLIDAGSVKLAIYNTLGQKVRTLQTIGSAGQHKITWYGKSDNGSQVASGIYFVVFRADSKMFSRKIVLVR